MKFFRVILTVYLSYLMFLPCIDKVNRKNCASEFQITSQTDQHHHMPSDDCSPFCVCSCCNIGIALTIYHFESKPLLASQEMKTILTYGFASDFFQAFWQPPELS